MTERRFDEMKASALIKWSKPERIDTVEDALKWWSETGRADCSFCYEFRLLGHGCEHCPLTGGAACALEWIELYQTLSFTLEQFHTLSAKLKKRIAAVTYEEVKVK